MKKTVLILAGGVGQRAGGFVPKQFRTICGYPMVWWAMRAFRREDSNTRIIVVCNVGAESEWERMWAGMAPGDVIVHESCAGGATRVESVANGLKLVDGEGLVAVHDAARPLVSVDMVKRCWQEAMNSGSAVPVVAVTDSLRRKDDNSSKAVDRSKYVAVQTPQVFEAALLKNAYDSRVGDSFTDDASVVEAAGHKVTLCEGEPTNMKVTNPQDFAVAEAIMRFLSEK